MRSPYRHSVWIDVFGVLLFGIVLLGGGAYLLYHAGGVATGPALEATQGSATPEAGRQTAQSVGRPGGAPVPQGHSVPRGEDSPLLGGRAEPPGVEAPFSASWRQEATPGLTGPAAGSAAPSAPQGRSGAPEKSQAPSGPAIASSRPSGGREGQAVQGGSVQGGGDAGSGWRADANRLAGRARALVGQLDQMERSASEKTSAQQEKAKAASGGQGSAKASSDPGTPDEPNQVPLGGLGWLAAAGIGYGLKRLWG